MHEYICSDTYSYIFKSNIIKSIKSCLLNYFAGIERIGTWRPAEDLENQRVFGISSNSIKINAKIFTREKIVKNSSENPEKNIRDSAIKEGVELAHGVRANY